MTTIADNDVCLSFTIADMDWGLSLLGVWRNGNHKIVHKIVNQVANIVPQEGPFFSTILEKDQNRKKKSYENRSANFS